ncbi:MAG TPA: radical SAM protein [bacterium]|nr:radical SAM protein [bacterium]HQP98762.1 radical SAM protein [bacterium]
MFIDGVGRVRKALRLGLHFRARHPREIQIELTNRCNFACRMCPHTTGAIPREDLSLDILDRLLAATPPIRNVVLTGWGEPLLHPRFLQAIDRIGDAWPSSNIRFTTNGSLLDEELARALVQRRVAGVTLSLDLWPDQEIADRSFLPFLHPPSEQVVDRIRCLAQVRNKMREPRIRLQCVASPVIRDHTLRIIDLAAELTLDEVNLVRLLPAPDHLDARPPWQEEQALLAELAGYGRNRGIRVWSVNRQPAWLRALMDEKRYCLKTDDSVYVTVAGDVTPCCDLRHRSFGNLQEVSGDILAVWRSPAWDDFFHNQRSVCGGCDALTNAYLLQPGVPFSEITTD